ncbi:unnamed protein product, partial [Symbiodinium sp. CCMP2592]
MVDHSPEQRGKQYHRRRRTLGWLHGHHVQGFAVYRLLAVVSSGLCLAQAFAASSLRSRSVAVSRRAEPDKVEVIQNAASFSFPEGAAFASSYLAPKGDSGLAAVLATTDQIGLVLLFAGVVISLGVYIRLNIWGEIEMTYSKALMDNAMKIPNKMIDDAPGLAEKIFAFIVGFIMAITLGVLSFTIGVIIDVVVGLLPTLAVLVPLGLALGNYAL